MTKRSILAAVAASFLIACGGCSNSEQADALASIERLGGVALREQGLLGECVTGLHLFGAQFGDLELKLLSRFPHLVRLKVASESVTDRGVKAIAALPRLKELELMQTRMTDAGAAALADLTGLEELRLQAAGLSPQAMERLRQLPGLKSFALVDPRGGGPASFVRQKLPADADGKSR